MVQKVAGLVLPSLDKVVKSDPKSAPRSSVFGFVGLLVATMQDLRATKENIGEDLSVI